MNDLTPTIDLLHSRDPGFFKDIKCFFCSNTQESLEHLVTCPSLALQWHFIIDSSVTHATTKLNKKWNSNIGSTIISMHIKDTDHLTYPNNNRLT